MPYQDEANAVLQQFLKKLFLREKKEFTLLASLWEESISGELDSLILKLASQENLSENKLYHLALYKEFQAQAEEEIRKYSQAAGLIISNEQKVYGEAGIDSAEKMIGLKTEFFKRLPKNTINNFIGRSYFDGNLLDKTLYARSFPDYMDKVKSELLKGVALGRNPKQVAKAISMESNAPLWQSYRLARTEQMSIFRTTAEMSMEKSGVLKGWERLEADDACDFCQSENGKVYEFGQEATWHPQCRGAKIPVLK
jgi:hypothetical protein